MGLFSKIFSHSSRKGHYPHHNHGSSYYKRRHKSHSGLLGSIISAVLSVKSYSHSHSHGHHHRRRRHSHYSSWS